jgi:hypothetical protein
VKGNIHWCSKAKPAVWFIHNIAGLKHQPIALFKLTLLGLGLIGCVSWEIIVGLKLQPTVIASLTLPFCAGNRQWLLY